MTRAEIISGSRNWTDVAIIRAIIDGLPAGTQIITGGQRGADTIAHNAAMKRYRTVGDIPEPRSMPAEWDKYLNPDGTVKGKGNPAGPIRNRAMLDYALTFDEQHLTAFPLGGPGTDGMISLARRAGFGVMVVGA